MNLEFLYEMLDTMSVSGHEIGLQKKVIDHMKPYAHEIRTDMTGNVICVLNPDADFKVMLAGHIDEIGLIVTHILPSGLIKVAKAGGIRAGTYPGHQVCIHHDGKIVPCVVIAPSLMRHTQLLPSVEGTLILASLPSPRISCIWMIA